MELTRPIVTPQQKEQLVADLWLSVAMVNAHLNRLRLYGFQTSVTENRRRSRDPNLPDEVFIVAAVGSEPMKPKS